VTIRVVIIGAGYTAREHARAFADIGDVEVVGIASRTRPRAAELAEDLGIPVVANDIPELFRRTNADLAVVAVPETAARSVVATAFDAGPWSLLLEKPPGFDLDDARALLDAAAASSSEVYVGLNRRFIGATLAVQHDLADATGRRYIRVQDQQDLDVARSTKPDVVVRNYMFANSIHTIDYLRHLARGDVEEVTSIVPWSAAEPALVIAAVAFSSGDLGIYEGIWNAPGPWAVSVTTPGRRWEMRPLERGVTQRTGEAPTELPSDPHDSVFKPGFRQQAAEVVAAVRGDSHRAVTLEDAFATMTLIARIYGLA